jgi:hypothetical protein
VVEDEVLARLVSLRHQIDLQQQRQFVAPLRPDLGPIKGKQQLPFKKWVRVARCVRGK